MRLPTLAAYLKSIKRPPGPPKSFFPNITFTLVRTERRYPNQAVFRCPLFLTKYDITNYLRGIYGINPIKVDTINYPTRFKMDLGRMIKIPTPALKKAIVTLDEVFDYPPTIELDQIDQDTRQRISLPRQPRPLFHSKKASKFIGPESQEENDLFTTRERILDKKPIENEEPELVQYK